VSIMSSLSKFVRSLTADKSNTDVPAGVSVPAQEEGAVEMPDREPMAGFEPDRVYRPRWARPCTPPCRFARADAPRYGPSRSGARGVVPAS
jgi:hypothetical protein